VEIADGENVRGFRQIRTNLRPELRPTVVCGTKKGEKLHLHSGMFEAEVFLVEVSAQGQPVFKMAGRFNDVHAGNDSEARKKKSNVELRALGFGFV